MKTNEKIRYEKLHYDINKDAAKKSAVSSGKIGKYEYLTGEEILTLDLSKYSRKIPKHGSKIIHWYFFK